MGTDDWLRVIDESAELGAGMVQFIGGEPTLFTRLPDLVVRALDRGLRVEVFSNLVRVTPLLWETFDRPGVGLATSYYSAASEEHEAITKGRGSHARTKANIVEAVRRSIPLRVGLIDVRDGQRVDEARAELEALGVTEIGGDRLREFGRGGRGKEPSLDQLCGHCARGKVAVLPSGDVCPCVFSRWMTVGNVRAQSLAGIIAGTAMIEAEDRLGVGAADKPGCDPRCCPSTMCDPQCSPSCSPSCNPAGNCGPKGNCAPKY